jgi:putative ABC transport system permease protein
MPQEHGENLRQAMDALRTHKLRSALTIFGVVLGVSVIMLVAALITGFDEQVQENVKQFGADTAFVTKWDQGRHGGPPPLEEIQRKPLTVDDQRALLESCPAIKNVTAFIESD